MSSEDTEGPRRTLRLLFLLFSGLIVAQRSQKTKKNTPPNSAVCTDSLLIGPHVWANEAVFNASADLQQIITQATIKIFNLLEGLLTHLNSPSVDGASP